jgi:hypothetical protein
MNSVRACRSRAGLDLVFKVVMFVINGFYLSSFLAVRRASPADGAGWKGPLRGWAATGGGPAALRLSGLRWRWPPAGELRDVAEVAGVARPEGGAWDAGRSVAWAG